MLSSGEAGPQGRFKNKNACTLPDMICQVLALPHFWELKFPGGPSVHRKCAHSAHVHENGFSRPPGDFTYTPPFSRPYRGFHDFHVFSRTFMVFSRPFAYIFTYVLWFSRPSPVFTPTPCFHVHTVIFEFIWPNGLWTHFSCPNGPPGCPCE